MNSKNAVHTQLFSILNNFQKTRYEIPDRLYVNGMANASSTVAPTTPTGSFLIGSTGRVSGIDEVRFSTFSAGAFQTSDLLYQSVPEPRYTYIILIISSLIIFRYKQICCRLNFVKDSSAWEKVLGCFLKKSPFQ